MKTMTCKQLGGACDKKFQAETWEEMSELSRLHGQEMAEKSDAGHLKAMEAMKELMKKPEELQEWMESKRREFEALS